VHQQFVREQRAETVQRLWALPKPIETVLVERGVDPRNVTEAVQALALVEIPVTAREALVFSFSPKSKLPPFYSQGRFGDGSYPVYYSALEEDTCAEEVKYHLEKKIAADGGVRLPFPRFYSLLVCDFEGTALMLCGQEGKYPDLVSPTEQGYPFCQRLAASARADHVDGFVTPSARRQGGVCAPVFVLDALSNPRIVATIRLLLDDEHTTYEQLPSPRVETH
jgi:hypothetical protein